MRALRHKSQVFFLVGPTAVGKTAVAQWIAERHGYDILSADSMLVYRGLDIGTAKPTAAERARVRYWGLDLVELGERFSVGDYRAAALAAIRSTRAAGRRLIVAGGTGLYIKCLTDGLADRPPGDAAIRKQAESLLAEQGVPALREWLGRLDPDRLEALADPQNPRRLIRALELAGAGVAARERTWPAPRTGPRITGLALPQQALQARIEARTRRMFAAGLLEETRTLLGQGLKAAPTAAQAIGYAEALKVLEGGWTIEEAVAAVALRTRHLAKRQLTWFRHQANVDWLEVAPDQPVADCARQVLAYWETHGSTPIAGL